MRRGRCESAVVEVWVWSTKVGRAGVLSVSVLSGSEVGVSAAPKHRNGHLAVR